jgi:signal transduction histidine kinase
MNSRKEKEVIKRNAELKQQLAVNGRKLKIEAGLEKVRAVALKMKKPADMLEVCKTISLQLEKLGVKEIRNVQTAIFYENKGTYMNYEYYAKHKKTIITETIYTNHKVAKAFAAKMLSGKGEVYTTHIKGKKVKDWIAYQKTTNVFIDRFLEKANSLNYYWHSLGPVALGISTYDPLSEEELNLFKRFLKVFELAYKRYMDIEQAMAQAREAKIETALERVRARTMAMQKSEELAETSLVLFQQFKELGETSEQISIGIFKEDENIMELYSTLYGSQWKEAAKVDLDEPVVMKKIHTAWKEQKRSLVIDITGKDLRKYNAYRKKLSNLEYKEDRWVIHIAFFSKGVLTFSTTEPHPQETIQLLERFAGVFEQTYTRFLDLKKAEAQAREAKIEAALERTRTQSMIMQHSNELDDTLRVFHEQVLLLSIPSAFSFLWLPDEKNDRHIFWAVWGEDKNGSTVFKSKAIDYPLDRKEPATAQCLVDWKSKEPVVSYHVPPAGVKNYFAAWQELIDGVEHLNPEYFSGGLYYVEAFMRYGCFGVMVTIDLTEDEKKLLNRFAVEFERTYTRFLDLQKAEAQARESQIELGLERVRARAMAMQSSNELSDLVDTVFKELTKLDFALAWCIINIIDEPSLSNTVWAANPDIHKAPDSYHMKFEDYPFHDAMMKGYKERKTKYIYVLEGEEKKVYDEYLFKETEFRKVPEEAQAASRAMEKYVVSFSFSNFGGLQTVGNEPLSNINLDILERFGKVFDLTYTRFNDLLKSEAQAREAKIEAALERVRSRTMAMQHSDELKDAALLLFQQVQSFGVDQWACGYNIWEADGKTCTAWMSRQGNIQPPFKTHPAVDHCFQHFYDAKQRGESFYVEEIGGDEIKTHYKRLISLPEFKSAPKEFFDEFIAPEFQIFHIAYFDQGYLMFITYKPVPQTWDIFKRFAKVFEQTYTRFLDLQKAEAQAREAKIETALERVRSRTMAMQKSEELSETAQILFQQFRELGEDPIQITIGIINEEKGLIEFRVTDWSGGGSQVNRSFNVSIDEPALINKMYTAWKEQKRSLVVDLSGKELQDWINYRNAISGVSISSGDTKGRRVISSAFFSKGHLSFSSPEPGPPESVQLLERFAGVFDLTYTRFLDLKNAEEQAREATIEAALEKVRGKAMAMHNSNDLTVTASMVFTELRKLGINPMRCGVGLITKEERKVTLYGATTSEKGDGLSLAGWANLDDHPVLMKQYDNWLKAEDYFPVLKGELLKTYYERLSINFTVPVELTEFEQYGYFLMFSEGFLFCWSQQPYNESEVKTLKRFASVIDLTFRRYIELQKSEANAREAVKQAALDRVRADIASMRTIADLDKITPLIWNELTILGIPFIRCGVFIMDGSQQLIHTFLSTPDGKAIAAFHLPYNITANIAQVLSHWRDKKNYIDHWDESAFAEFANILVKQGELASAEQYLKTIPQGGFYLHFLPFLQGMLYVGNTTQLSEEEIKLIQSVADAFSTAYARYEDFNRLEAAKQQVEKTLVDLKQAQTQLVQSEKMASLGELTAGIAHEIQNPLNFVNNFSDVSNELLEEMKVELEKGNKEDAMAIVEDVKQNLEKILHHGKRADAIVKGMLQHSRTSSGQKELTDINVLTDEYVRLCYHGLRAKDKTFNAKFETDFDNSIGKINIVPQDIGRVILNLINNAFYAASLPSPEKIRTGAGGSTDSDKNNNPAIWVSTKKVGDKVLISVRDNGPGIPQKILDKIFQPFFTTKPTGQGTGLGLSLSYDIVKAHGGELKVETKEGEGSEFIIQLPTAKAAE